MSRVRGFRAVPLLAILCVACAPGHPSAKPLPHASSSLSAANTPGIHLDTSGAPTDQWYARRASDLHSVIPVPWNTQSAGSPLIPASLPHGGIIDFSAASPNGQMFLLDEQVTKDGHADIVDIHGRLLLQLDPEPFYRWSDDSTSLCVMHHAEGDADDMRLGIIALRDGSERDIYRFHPQAGLGLHAVVSCAPSEGRLLVEEIMANNPDSPSPATVAALLAIATSGATIRSFDFERDGMRTYVVGSDDGAFFAESPVDPKLPGRVISTLTGAVVATLSGQHVHAFDGRDDTVLTADAPAAPGREDAPVTLRLVEVVTGRVLWSQSGYLRGALSRPGHDDLVVGVAQQRDTTNTGYDLIALDRFGRSSLVVAQAFFS